MYDMYYNFIILIYVCIKSNVKKLLNHDIYFGWDMFVVSINVGAQVAIFTHFTCIWTLCGHCKLVGTGLYLG